LSKSNFDRLSRRFGPADTYQLAPVAANLASFETILKDQRIFGGLQDATPPSLTREASSLPGGVFRSLLVGYLGADGPLGPLSLLNLGPFSATNGSGFARSALGGWRLTAGDFTLFSFQAQVLANVAPELKYVEAAEPAQVRIDVGDVSQARITPVLNNLGYGRTAETSRGNLRLLHELNQQLNLPIEECREVAEDLLDAKLICPLGGEYGLKEAGPGMHWWTSSALVGSPRGGMLSETAPEGFVAPPLNWFRGLQAHMRILPGTLSVHAEVVMEQPK
jgi:hypothetical protein